jgi:hypothetical protein
MNDFNQRTAWVAQAIMALIKYGPVVLEIIKGLRSLVSDKKEETVTAEYSDYREAGFVDDIISSVKTLPSQIPDILSNPSTKKWISEKFNLDESTVGVISDLLKRVIDAMGSNPEEVEKEVRENPEISPTEEKPSLISKATKYSPVATQINSNSFVLREGSEESHELEDRIIALAKMYDVEELRDIEIELSKEGEILSIRRKEAFSPLSPDFGVPGWVSSLISIGSGKLINPNTSYWERGESYVAGMIGGPMGGLGYNLGKKMGHEYLGFLAGLVLQSVLNRTVLAKDPNASDEDKKKADANVSDSQKQSYTYYLAMKNQNSNNPSIKLVQDKMVSDKVDEETAFWRLMHDKSSEIVKAMGETA